MKTEYVRLITELDRTLNMIRGLWIDALKAEERNKWRVRIDELLDERLRLMRCRDAFAETAP